MKTTVEQSSIIHEFLLPSSTNLSVSVASIWIQYQTSSSLRIRDVQYSVFSSIFRHDNYIQIWIIPKGSTIQISLESMWNVKTMIHMYSNVIQTPKWKDKISKKKKHKFFFVSYLSKARKCSLFWMVNIGKKLSSTD